MKRGYQIRKMGLYKGIIRNKEVSKQDEWRVCRVEEEASGMITNTKDLCKQALCGHLQWQELPKMPQVGQRVSVDPQIRSLLLVTP